MSNMLFFQWNETTYNRQIFSFSTSSSNYEEYETVKMRMCHSTKREYENYKHNKILFRFYDRLK